MTENEAIKEIKRWTSILMSAGSQCVTETAEAQELAIKALEEIQQYRAIGTIEEFKALKEKTKPKKPIDKIMYLECPACGDVGILDCGYCSVCGQKLDWSE